MSTTKQGRDKFQPGVIPCVFLGYPYSKKAYKVMDLEHHKFYNSRDIVFHETIFPYVESSTQFLFSPTNSAIPIEDPSHFRHTEPTITEPPCADSPGITQQAEPTPQSVKRSSRVQRPPQYLEDYVLSAQGQSFCFATLTNLSLQPSLLPINYLHSTNQKFLANLDFTRPQSYDEAISYPGWQEAMEKELHALYDTHTWTIVSLP